MTFQQWLDSQPHGTAARIARQTKLSRTYIGRLGSGEPVYSFYVASLLIKATGRKVTLKALFADWEEKRGADV